MVSSKAKIGKNVTIKDGVIIEDNVIIGDDCYIDYNAIIKSNVEIGHNSFVGANCIIGEVLGDFFDNYENKLHPLKIGEHALIRSQCIIYGGSQICSHFSTGHKVIIRENSSIGHHVSIGTLSDIQGDCTIGNYSRLHSNVHVGMKTTLEDFVWVFPYVIFTNDPTPPSETLLGSTIKRFAVICTGSVVLPGLTIESNSLVGAGTTVTKSVPELAIVVGNPGKVIGNVNKICSADGQPKYPWYNTFSRGMPWENVGFEEWSNKNKL